MTTNLTDMIKFLEEWNEKIKNEGFIPTIDLLLETLKDEA